MMGTVLRSLLIAGIYLVFLFVLWQMDVPLMVLWVMFALLLVIQRFFANTIAVFSLGARTVSEREAPALHTLIDRLVAQANLPKPRVALIHATEPGAFATGRSGQPRMITVTTGLLCRCTRQELERVLAYELSHPIDFGMGVVVVVMIFTLFAAGMVMAFL